MESDDELCEDPAGEAVDGADNVGCSTLVLMKGACSELL
jgi:hypothetical protein